MVGSSACLIIGWLISWWINQPACWLVGRSDGWLDGQLVNWLVDCLVHQLVGLHAYQLARQSVSLLACKSGQFVVLLVSWLVDQ